MERRPTNITQELAGSKAAKAAPSSSEKAADVKRAQARERTTHLDRLGGEKGGGSSAR